MLKTRLLTASILCALVIYTLSFSPESIYFYLLVGFVSLTVLIGGAEFASLRWHSMQEVAKASKTKKTSKNYPPLETKFVLMGLAYALPIPLLFLSSRYFPEQGEKQFSLLVGWVFVTLLFSAALIYRTAFDLNTATNKLLNFLSGYLYLFLPAVSLLLIAFLEFQGAPRGALVYLCLGTIFMGDTGAYFVGTRFGKRKLIPRVSPSKSLEGALGGLLTSGLTAVLATHILNLHFHFFWAFMGGIVLGIGGQVGDLLESALKRAGNYKDSGCLLPGHGGVLDRVDSLLIGLPIAYAFFTLII